MKNDLLAFLKRLLPFTLFLWLIQFLLQQYVLELDFYYSSFSIYLFHFVATFLIYSILVFVYRNFTENTGFAFMGLSLLKMVMAVIFLLPLVLSGLDGVFSNILAFFIPYFLFLIFETLYAVKLINKA
ncbi:MULTISPECIES: hypothetical protein [Salegentibacter]|uniref:ATP synthase protein I n=1 Tax=Salegentibacter maritimus TaxID=2794347 RepID=A0ABS0TIP4_9FLAO|nr:MULTISPECIES: hypothetical protein [Salegentibacter]MBE7641481.1 hypothetical protein [Salegentibacter sp. BLCTC]MBI6116181.1 hypothetical protein [Salegentibacter maritimus]MBI6120937.1 hypothetical protein [Salegentibacter maritimus]